MRFMQIASICKLFYNQPLTILQDLKLKFVKDISVFVEARSSVGETNWFWENGTKVNDPRYPISNQSVCQQMSLPLTYDDGINLLPKRCDQDEAYFVCESPSKLYYVESKHPYFVFIVGKRCQV